MYYFPRIFLNSNGKRSLLTEPRNHNCLLAKGSIVEGGKLYVPKRTCLDGIVGICSGYYTAFKIQFVANVVFGLVGKRGDCDGYGCPRLLADTGEVAGRIRAAIDAGVGDVGDVCVVGSAFAAVEVGAIIKHITEQRCRICAPFVANIDCLEFATSIKHPIKIPNFFCI